MRLCICDSGSGVDFWVRNWCQIDALGRRMVGLISSFIWRLTSLNAHSRQVDCAGSSLPVEVVWPSSRYDHHGSRAFAFNY